MIYTRVPACLYLTVCSQWGFTGISTFAHLKHVRCLTTPSELFDIAIIGAPFDTAVSYRPGRSPPQYPVPIPVAMGATL